MIHRRFGKTELQMPVLTCGAMRYQQSWSDIDAGELDGEKQANLEATVRRAVAAGMNHIETARGYGSSECQLGFVLPTFPREEILVQTKITPQDSEDAFLRLFDRSMARLQLDHVDLLAIHGINNRECLEKTLKKGTLSACRRLQDAGRARHIGFSSHGYAEDVVAAIETREFSYVNLHWYYFDQSNWPAVAAATRQDMGVFIISPNDKGGKLYDPPARLTELCDPLTPMGFNDLFCLSHPEVHTLSIGATRPSDYDAHLDILPGLDAASVAIAPVLVRLHEAQAAEFGEDWAAGWLEGLPNVVRVPDELPLYHILRMLVMARACGMNGFGEMRYNLLGNGDHWFPGQKVDKVDWDRLDEALGDYRFRERIPGMLSEAHELFNAEDKKRLSES
jgi:uncharacterized protein